MRACGPTHRKARVAQRLWARDDPSRCTRKEHGLAVAGGARAVHSRAFGIESPRGDLEIDAMVRIRCLSGPHSIASIKKECLAFERYANTFVGRRKKFPSSFLLLTDKENIPPELSGKWRKGTVEVQKPGGNGRKTVFDISAKSSVLVADKAQMEFLFVGGK